ncbi:MAG: hypothetical protein QF687_06715 [Nitrospinaceae bacterium]|jgi:hypothetical protein|nr:hypothetical protein [Nitrospinaceae bacterium]|tara:strand:+ start:657 stop:1175 length:519 start_codon:yes stop_codon:yes gene_type:complete
MLKTCQITVIAVFCLLPVLSGAEEFKLYLDDSRTDYVMAEKQDCSVYETEDGRITLGFKAGGLFFGIGPEITFGEKTGIDWDNLVQRLVARYLELCTRFNTGSISKAAYDSRLKKIESIEAEAYELHQNFIKEKAGRKDKMFDELENETRGPDFYKKAYHNINQKIDGSQIP